MSNINLQDVIERLKDALDLDSEGEVLKRWDVVQAYVSRVKKHKPGVIPKKKELRKLCERENLNYDWVITGDGNMLGGDAEVTVANDYKAIEDYRRMLIDPKNENIKGRILDRIEFHESRIAAATGTAPGNRGTEQRNAS